MTAPTAVTIARPDAAMMGRVLMLIERDLRRRVLPELTSPGTRLQIDYITRLLQWLAVQVRGNEAATAAHDEGIEALVASDDASALPAAPPGFAGDSDDDAAARLRAIAGAADGGALLDRYAALEAEFVQALDAEGGRGYGDVFKGGKLHGADAAAAPAIDEARLTAYLRDRFPDYPDALVMKVDPLTGGFGKDTILATIARCGAIDGDVVIRKDFAIRPGPISVTAEFPLLRALHGTDVPVAEPLWAEPDARVLGGEFIVSRRAAGATAASGWAGSAEARRHFVGRLAETLAAVHRVTLAMIDAPSIGARSAVTAVMQLYYDHYRARADRRSDRLETLFAWLHANLPASDDIEARLVHGDCGFHNMLMADGELTALLDWEFAHIGDPAEDIGYCWQFIDSLVAWDDFIAMYRSYGGGEVTRRDADFYRIWGDVRNACMGVGAVGTMFLSDQADIRSPAAGLAFGPLMEIQALKAASAWSRGGMAA